MEPSGAVNILWKDQQVTDMMHRSDPVLQSLDAKAESGQDVAAEIAAREKLLKPLFSQVAFYVLSSLLLCVGDVSRSRQKPRIFLVP